MTDFTEDLREALTDLQRRLAHSEGALAELRASVVALAEQVRNAEYEHTRSPLVRELMTDDGASYDVLSADAVSDAIAALAEREANR